MEFDLSAILRYAPLLILPAAVAEGLILSRIKSFDWRSFGGSVGQYLLRSVSSSILQFSLAAPLVAYCSAHALFRLKLDSWQMVAILILAQEFFYYWYHRASHRVRWLWVTHTVHHSPNDLSFAAALRASSLLKLTGATIFFLPLVWVGFSPGAVLAVLGLNLLYQFWVHATWIPKLGPLEYVINTPSSHRVHHATNSEYLNSNYGGILIIFDRIFGTYVPERADLPCRYGLTHPQLSNNPLRIELDPWIAFFRDLAACRKPTELLKCFFGPPEWRPGR